MSGGYARLERFSFEPVERLLDGMNRSEQARALRVDRATVHKWVREGITVRHVDKVAFALGHHPAELWDQWGQV